MTLLGMASQKSLIVTQLLQSLAVGHTQADTPDRSSQTTSVLKKPITPLDTTKREARFNLPVNTAPIRPRKPSTLNILGEQPEFDPKLLGSAVTLFTQITIVKEKGETPETSYCSPSRVSTVGTQSLLESEVIPSPPPSTHSSATSLLTDTDLSLALEPNSQVSVYYIYTVDIIKLLLQYIYIV